MNTLLATADLEGMLLDVWVARAGDPRCAGLRFDFRETHFVGIDESSDDAAVCCLITDAGFGLAMVLQRTYGLDVAADYKPSTQNGDGVRLMQAERIGAAPLPEGQWQAYALNAAGEQAHSVQGRTLLEAGMRCYIGLKHGPFVPTESEIIQPFSMA